jgi:hypothetical protein
MPVGFPTKTTYANGDVFSADDINSTNGTINLLQTSTLSNSAGKNAVINGGMSIWQRGTSISLAASAGATYLADRWQTFTGANQACTVSRQATGDTTNLPTIQYALRYQRNSGQTGTGGLWLTQPFESVNSIPFAGRAVTLSFYARRGANYSAASNLLDVYLVTGTGTDQNLISGYTGSTNAISSNATLTTTWQRFTYTATLASTITEIGLLTVFNPTGTAGANDWYEITGVQVELGSYPTTFSRAGGTIQGELAACQRYFQAYDIGSNQRAPGTGLVNLTTEANIIVKYFCPMRTAPTLSTSGTVGNMRVFDGTSIGTVTAVAISVADINSARLSWTTSGIGISRPAEVYQSAAATFSLLLSSEL